MRIAGAFMIIVLIAVALVLVLRSMETKHDVEAVRSISSNLHESGVEARAFDRGAALRTIRVLQGFLDTPGTIASSLDRLQAIARTAAAWAQGAPEGSAALDTAVALRSAADELRSYGLYGGERHLMEAKRQLAAARAGLNPATSARPVTADVRDRLQNLQRSEQEQMQHLDQALQHQ